MSRVVRPSGLMGQAGAEEVGTGAAVAEMEAVHGAVPVVVHGMHDRYAVPAGHAHDVRRDQGEDVVQVHDVGPGLTEQPAETAHTRG